ncbi:MAG: alpha/beta hydrolase [Paracoccaceae bacterium]|nr:alpha/beta hydrolase [Paracoccaceae bacterium]
MSYLANRTEGAPGAPLVFTFHGTGGDETQFHRLAGELVPGARVVSPRGDVSEHGALRYFRRTGEGRYDIDDLARRTAAMAAFVAAEKDDRETIALGYSNGANIAASVSFEAPECFDRMVLLHPLIPFEPAPQPGLASRKVLITAGERDPICPPDATRRLETYYRAQGAEVTVAWHGGGHEIRQEEIEAIGAFLARQPA